MKNIKILLAVSTIGLFVLYRYMLPKDYITIDGHTIKVELADTTYKQMRGLMFKWYLPKNSGMLFTFEYPSKHSFWMKYTKIPLDMIWFDENFNIIHIQHSAPPCIDNPCATYAAPNPTAKYVLEVNGGWADTNNIQVGMQAVVNP